MPTYVYRDGRLIDKNLAQLRSGSKLAHNLAPYVISDEMPSLQHMADGRFYTSKRKFRDATKAAGCIEYGSDVTQLLAPRRATGLDRMKRRDAIRQAIYQLRNGKER